MFSRQNIGLDCFDFYRPSLPLPLPLQHVGQQKTKSENIINVCHHCFSLITRLLTQLLNCHIDPFNIDKVSLMIQANDKPHHRLFGLQGTSSEQNRLTSLNLSGTYCHKTGTRQDHLAVISLGNRLYIQTQFS